VVKSRPNAVFSPNDFVVIRKALQHYHKEYGTTLSQEEFATIASLMHRLNRIYNGK